MPTRCLALLSGGLDSMLAIRLMQEQDIEVEAVNFKTIFSCCQDDAGQAARDLGVRLTVIDQDDDYLKLVRKPVHGYGKGANPCVDCRIYMFQRSIAVMDEVGAQFVVSGEVVGQRPMSQKRRDLDIISRMSQLEDRLLRPLSAKILPPTRPEREGYVDRRLLYGFTGRSRKGLIELANQFGFRNIPSPSTGCTLTEKQFSHKVFDLIQLDPDNTRWDFELLRIGRHFRFDRHIKIVIGRNQADNQTLRYIHGLEEARSTVLLNPENFPGSLGLIVGKPTDAAIEQAGALILKYSNRHDPDNALIRVQQKGTEYVAPFTLTRAAQEAETVACAK